MGPRSGRKPHHRHDREPAGLGRVASARLGCRSPFSAISKLKIPGPDFDKSEELAARIEKAFAESGADVWFEAGAQEVPERIVTDTELPKWEQVKDVLDVWFN